MCHLQDIHFIPAYINVCQQETVLFKRTRKVDYIASFDKLVICFILLSVLKLAGS